MLLNFFDFQFEVTHTKMAETAEAAAAAAPAEAAAAPAAAAKAEEVPADADDGIDDEIKALEHDMAMMDQETQQVKEA